MPENKERIGFFDVETQYLFKEIEPRWRNMKWSEKALIKKELTKKLKLAIAGILTSKGECKLFTEDNVSELFKELDSFDLIIGHNLIEFDYLVLDIYAEYIVVEKYQNKTFDTLKELEKITGNWTNLDDLAKLNLGTEKTENTLKIPKMWRDGKKEEVINYLKKDLEIVKEIYNHGRINGTIEYTHKDYGKIEGVRTVKVDW